MAQCAYCRTEIELLDGGVLICNKCSERRAAEGIPTEAWLRVRVTLNMDLIEATARADSAAEAYFALVGEDSARV